MPFDAALQLSHETRIAALERERGGIAADISSLRTEMRTEIKNIKETLSRIEDKLDERPSRSEMVEGMRSRAPKFEIDGKNMLMKVSGAAPIIFSVLALTLAVLAWLSHK